MNTRLLKTFLASLLMLPTVAWAASSSGACYNISDSDARAYCLARARNDASVCYNIQSPDMRSMCLAEVRR